MTRLGVASAVFVAAGVALGVIGCSGSNFASSTTPPDAGGAAGTAGGSQQSFEVR